MEGFEKVLATDRDYMQSPAILSAPFKQNAAPPLPARTITRPALPTNSEPVARPSLLRAHSLASPATIISAPVVRPMDKTDPSSSTPTPFPAGPKKNRFSMDFITSAIWKHPPNSTSAPTATLPPPTAIVSTSPNPPLPGFKPMMLNPASAARRMSLEEDDEDQRIRARLQSEMKLLGIDNHGSPVLHANATLTPMRALSNRSPKHDQRLSGSSFKSVGSSRPPSVPPKDELLLFNEREKRLSPEPGHITSSVDLALPSSPGGGSLMRNGSVRVSGHRKRPSASSRESMLATGSLSSIGLGLSYSKDSNSNWSSRSPSAISANGGDKETFDAKRRSSGGDSQ